jgi:hypothetical protein
MGEKETSGTGVLSRLDGNGVEEILGHRGAAQFGSICQLAVTKSHIEDPKPAD